MGGDQIQLSHFFFIFYFDGLPDKYLGGYFYVGTNTYYDDILEFDPLTGQWKLVDRMIQARMSQAVSVITFDSGLCVTATTTNWKSEWFIVFSKK